jgi:exonuclease III
LPSSEPAPDALAPPPARAVRVVAWNIRHGGGIRAAAIATQLCRWRADVVALGEFRGTPPSLALAAHLARRGLAHQLHTAAPRAPAANRLLVAARWPIERLVVRGAPERGGRWLAARVDAPRPFAVGAMHVPNRVTGRKWPFHAAVLRVIRGWDGLPALLVGDTNTGRIGVDEARSGLSGFNAREDGWMVALDAAGWRDAFRHLHGPRREWTWYSPNMGTGYRLDQAFVNAALIERLLAARHRWGRLPRSDRRDALSDHAALVLDLTP